MIIICGRTIAEVEHDLEMAKAAIATGAPIGVGGATLADVEQAMRGLRSAMGEHSPTEHKCDCACAGGTCYGCGCADEEEVEYCPICGCELDEDGICDNCGYPCEEEEEDEELTLEDIDRLVDKYNISAEEVDDIVNKYGLPTICGEMVKRALGL